jgi:zinc D-Ala-D-Ala dipeptidase
MRKYFLSLLLILLIVCPVLHGQDSTKNKYGLYVVSDVKSYERAVHFNKNNMLINLKNFIPGIRLDIRYATSNNFLGEPIYKKAEAFLRLPAAIELKAVQNELAKRGLGLKIFDGYRPYSATVKFYLKVKDTVYVASAWTGSRHNRGCAVDLTLVNLKTGKELKMPTGFDSFSDMAHSDYENLPKNVKTNRKLLIDVMTKHGFTNYSAEWWHFDFNGWKDFPLTDLSFSQLDSLAHTAGNKNDVSK